MPSVGASYLEKHRTNVLPGRVMLLHMQFAVALLTYSFETRLDQNLFQMKMVLQFTVNQKLYLKVNLKKVPFSSFISIKDGILLYARHCMAYKI